MIPLIDRSLYQRLVDKRAEMESAGVHDLGRVFVPIGPALSDKAPIRLLFVGQAEGPTEAPLEADFDQAVEHSIGVVEELADSPKGFFWPAVWRVLDQVLEMSGASVDRHQAVGWSNLVKIGKANRERPEGKEISDQADLCIQALQLEIRAFRPDAIILLTTNYAQDKILYPVFGREGFRNNVKSEDQVAVKRHPEFGVVLWANHPRVMRRKGPAVEAFISGYVAALTSVKPTVAPLT